MNLQLVFLTRGRITQRTNTQSRNPAQRIKMGFFHTCFSKLARISALKARLVGNPRLSITANHLVLFAITCTLLSCQEQPKAGDNEVFTFENKHIVAYVMGTRKWVNIEKNISKITHINYAFADVVDGEVVNYMGNDSANFAQLNALKTVNPNLKILVSIGGWARSKGFSDAALTAASRQRFAKSAVNYLERYHLDGLDIDWEYPGLPGDNNPHRPEDKENFTLMLQALRAQLDTAGAAYGTHFLLTIASAASEAYLAHTELGIAHQSLDFINIMTYDFVGGWSDTVWHHANLHSPNASGVTARSAEKAVRDHVAAGIPVEKLVLGVAFYGRGWRSLPSETPLQNPANESAFSLPYHRIVAQYEGKNDFQRMWDEAANAPYLWHPNGTFITYDDPVSLQKKAQFIHENRLAGAMFWEYSSDTTGALLKVLADELFE